MTNVGKLKLNSLKENKLFEESLKFFLFIPLNEDWRRLRKENGTTKGKYAISSSLEVLETSFTQGKTRLDNICEA